MGWRADGPVADRDGVHVGRRADQVGVQIKSACRSVECRSIRVQITSACRSGRRANQAGVQIRSACKSIRVQISSASRSARLPDQLGVQIGSAGRLLGSHADLAATSASPPPPPPPRCRLAAASPPPRRLAASLPPPPPPPRRLMPPPPPHRLLCLTATSDSPRRLRLHLASLPRCLAASPPRRLLRLLHLPASSASPPPPPRRLAATCTCPCTCKPYMHMHIWTCPCTSTLCISGHGGRWTHESMTHGYVYVIHAFVLLKSLGSKTESALSSGGGVDLRFASSRHIIHFSFMTGWQDSRAHVHPVELFRAQGG